MDQGRQDRGHHGPLIIAAPLATARVIAIGIAALAVAIGIGRFAFTPLLPLMLRDGTLDAATGAEWAAANYVGYLLGALTASRFAADPLRGLRHGLYGVAFTTLAVGVLTAPLLPLGGAVLRLAAGVFSAWTLVCASSWCLSQLAQRDSAERAAWVYTGVGLGIALAGVLAWLGGSQSAGTLWLELGVLATAGAVFGGARQASPERTVTSADASRGARRTSAQQWALVFCYGSFGFGYIVPATFLPAMAREEVADPLVFGLTWPLFGLAAALSVAAVARWLRGWTRRRVWALAQVVMALGTAVLIMSQAIWALAVSAVLVGSTFMVATMAGLQLAREYVPDEPTPLMARMTVSFATGQIAGPLLVRALGAERLGFDALWWANVAATVLLAVTAAWLALAPGRR